MLHVNECPCGRCYDVFQWNALPLVGYQTDDVERLELRNCLCGSTRSVPVCELLAADNAAFTLPTVRDTIPAPPLDDEPEDDGDAEADRQIDALDMIGLDPWGHEKSAE